MSDCRIVSPLVPLNGCVPDFSLAMRSGLAKSTLLHVSGSPLDLDFPSSPDGLTLAGFLASTLVLYQTQAT